MPARRSGMLAPMIVGQSLLMNILLYSLMKNSASVVSCPMRILNRSSNNFCSNHSSDSRVEEKASMLLMVIRLVKCWSRGPDVRWI